MIVSNSGPIVSFARARRLELLKQILQEIRIPDAVYEEIVRGADKPGAAEVKSGEWIKKEAIQNRSQVYQLPSRLGLGEREAIILAQELKIPLLIDDRLARKEAEQRGIVCFGSLRVLKEAKNKKFINEIKPVGDELRRAGLRIKNSLYQKFLQEVGE